MIAEDTKFYVAPENMDRMALYTVLAPVANLVLQGMAEGTITDPDGPWHFTLVNIFTHIPRFQDPVDGFTTIEFTGASYIGDKPVEDASLVGWRYVTTTEGKLGVAAKYDANDEFQIVAGFALWQTA